MRKLSKLIESTSNLCFFNASRTIPNLSLWCRDSVLGSLRSYPRSWAKGVSLLQILRIETTLTPCWASVKTNYLPSSIPFFTYSSKRLYLHARSDLGSSLSPWRPDHSVSSYPIQINICRIQVTYHQPVQYQHPLLRQLEHFASRLVLSPQLSTKWRMLSNYLMIIMMSIHQIDLFL